MNGKIDLANGLGWVKKYSVYWHKLLIWDLTYVHTIHTICNRIYTYILEVLIKLQLRLLVIIYEFKIHLVNTHCWTQQTSTQYTLQQSNQVKKIIYIYIFYYLFISEITYILFLNFIKSKVIFFNTSLIEKSFFFFFWYYFYLCYFGSSSTLFYFLNLNQLTFSYCSINHYFLDQIISNDSLSFFSSIGATSSFLSLCVLPVIYFNVVILINC